MGPQLMIETSLMTHPQLLVKASVKAFHFEAVFIETASNKKQKPLIRNWILSNQSIKAYLKLCILPQHA